MGELDGKKRKPSSNSSGLELLDQVSHGARPVHLILTMVKWIRTGRLSIKNSLALYRNPNCSILPHLLAFLFGTIYSSNIA